MKKGHTYNYINKYSAAIEITAGIFGVMYLIYSLRGMLITGDTMLPHDHIYWGYPVFQFSVENIINGHFPLWNPFTHGGEPFYPGFMHLKLLDPVTLLTIYIGRFITSDIAILYNWNYFLQILVTSSGVYWILRSISENIFIRISLVPVLLYSSFMLSSFRQAGIICQFMWVPFIIQFLLRIIYHKDYRWHNWIIIGGLTGINWQSYYFSGTWTILFAFFFGLFIFHRHLLGNVLSSRNAALKITLTSIIVFIMMLPNVFLFLDKEKYVYPARMIPADYEDKMPMGGPQQSEGTALPKSQGILMPYKLVAYTGTFSTVWDFIQLISSDGNRFIQKPDSKNIWGNPSEAYMYIGFMPWAIGLLGMAKGRHELKRMWLFMLVFFGLLALGPAGGLHRILFYIYPPLWFVRHTHTFSIFFLFAFLYFYVLGFNHIFSTLEESTDPQDKARGGIPGVSTDRISGTGYLRKVIVLILFTAGLAGLVYWMTRLEYPESNYIFLLIILCVIIGWLLRKDLGREGILAGVMSAQISFVLFFNAHPLHYLISVLLLIIVPLVLFLIINKNKRLADKYYLAPVLIVIFSVGLIGDLSGHLHLASSLYKGQRHPGKAFGLDTTIHKPEFINSRSVAPLQLYGDDPYKQSIRYLSIVNRRPYVFSGVMEKRPDLSEDTDEFTATLRSKRWSSFSLPKKYFELINLDMPPLAMKEMFAVGKPLLQFKQGIVGTDETDFAHFMTNLGPERAVQLLNNYVLVDNSEADSSLKQFRISSSDYFKLIQDDYYGHKSLESNNDFSYAVTEYDYNSLGMNVTSGKKGILYWSDGYDSRWHAYVNGLEMPVFRTNVNFKAIALPQGTSRVKFIYEHPLINMALLAYYCSLIISGVLALISWLYEGRRASLSNIGKQ